MTAPTFAQLVAAHGPPTRARTGVLTDHDGHQPTIRWTLRDGTTYQQCFMPAETETAAYDQSQQIANVIRKAYTDLNIESDNQP